MIECVHEDEQEARECARIGGFMALGDKVVARIQVGSKIEDVVLEATTAGGTVVVAKTDGMWEAQELGRTGKVRRRLVINPDVLLTLMEQPR